MFPDPSEPCTRLAPSQEPGRGIRERQGQLTRKQDGHIWTFMGRSPFQEKQKRVLLHRSSGFSGPGRQHQHPHKEDAPRLITQTARVPRPLSPRGRFLSVPESSALQRKRLFSELLRRQRNRELGVLLTLSGLGISESGTARPVRCWGVEGVHLPV